MDEIILQAHRNHTFTFQNPGECSYTTYGAKGTRGTIEIYPEFAEGLTDLQGFSHIMLLFHMHLVENHRLKVIPFLDTVERGIFSTRAPVRPNPIGLTVVKLIGIENNILTS